MVVDLFYANKRRQQYEKFKNSFVKREELNRFVSSSWNFQFSLRNLLELDWCRDMLEVRWNECRRKNHTSHATRLWRCLTMEKLTRQFKVFKSTVCTIVRTNLSFKQKFHGLLDDNDRLMEQSRRSIWRIRCKIIYLCWIDSSESGENMNYSYLEMVREVKDEKSKKKVSRKKKMSC